MLKAEHNLFILEENTKIIRLKIAFTGRNITMKQTLPCDRIPSDRLIGQPAQILTNDKRTQRIWIRSWSTFVWTLVYETTQETRNI